MTMSEVIPAFSYSHEGNLVVARAGVEVQQAALGGCGAGARADRPLEEARDRAVEWLAELSGVSLEETKDAYQLTIPIAEALEEDIADPRGGRIDTFLKAIHTLQPTKQQVRVDNVITTPVLSSRLVKARVNHRLQLWLNQEGLTEEAARDCLLAMAMPFSARVTEEAIKRDFDYRKHSRGAFAMAKDLKITASEEDFGFERFRRRFKNVRKSTGEATWQAVSLDTYGVGGCGIAVDENARQTVQFDPDSKQLYQMRGFNVDHGHKALSILLGLGSLARRASCYVGTEDVFSDVNWGKYKK